MHKIYGQQRLHLFRLYRRRFEGWCGRYLSDRNLMIGLSVVVGLLSGLAAVVLKNLIFYFSEFIINLGSADKWNYLFLFLPLVGVTLSYLYVRYVVKDNISHGVTRVLHSFSRARGRIKRSKMYSSVVACTVTIGFGGSVGPEAPVVLTGAAIGSNVGRFFNMGFRNLVLLIACGSAGAIAGIFGAPLAGLVFTLEVLMIDLTMESLIPILIASTTGAVTSVFFLGRAATFHFDVTADFMLQNLPFYLILGIAGGFVSCYFLFVTERMGQWFGRIRKPLWRILAGGLSLSLLIFIFPPFYGEGFNFLSDIFNGDTTRIFNNTVFYSWQHNPFVFFGFLLLLILLKVVATCLTNGAGGVGGVFAPSMFVGAFLGLFVAEVFNAVFGLHLPIANFALAGMAALMAGVMHAPLTAIFLVTEVTGGYNFFIPLMLVSAAAYLVSRHFNPHSIYTKSLALKGELLTHNKDAIVLSLMSVERLIERNFVTISPDDTLGQLVESISRSSRNIFPVTASDGEFLGIVFLDDIKTLIFKPELYGQITVKELMYKPQTIIYRQENMEQVARKFHNSPDYNIPVLDGKTYVGFVSRANVFSNYRNKVKEFSND
ncbi:MAG: chloride channel protein [Bacteroides sp.]|nr:chloride channel protein [Ruminococcus flavefaciens]MCM1555726.1 chloride channel protein [Bacteroides sp.]